MPDILVVIPTHNEVESLERTVGRVRQTVPHAGILIVDDDSPDGTGALADRLAGDDAGIEVIHRAGERGLASACIDAFRHAIDAGATAVALTDADGSFESGLLPDMFAASLSGVDLVIGSRWVPGGDVRNMKLRRRVLSHGGNIYARMALGSEVRDMTSGFRVYRTSMLQRLDLAAITSEGYAFQIEMTMRVAQAGGRIVEVASAFTERALGHSMLNVGLVADTLRRVTTWWVGGVRARPKPRSIGS